MKNSLLQVLKFLIGWPLSIIALFFLLKLIYPKITVVAEKIFHVNFILLFAGMFCLLVYFFLRSYFWQKLLEIKGHNLTFKETAFIWGISELKRFVPGNIWAFVGRLHHFGEKGVSKSTVFSSTFIEVQFIAAATLIISLLSLNFIVYGLLADFPFKILLSTSAWFGTFFAFAFLLRKNKKDNLILLATMISSYFFFGLGTYLTICSIIYLYLPDILTFVGFFVFSYVIGFASFITPMGIGVREAVITAGLTRFLNSLPLSAIAAIFARVILIITELIFLAIVAVWHNSKYFLVKRAEDFVKTHKTEICLVALITIYICYFSIASFLRYTNFYTGRFDLGNMDQTVWNTMHGRIFQLTNPDGTNIISRLGIHADFILILLAPFYAFWQDPRMLLLIQTVVISFGAIFVYLISKIVLKNKFVSLIFAFAYLFNPSLQHSNLYDFHAVTLATTFILGSFYFLIKRKYIFGLIFLLLAAFTKEQVWIVSAIFGLFIFFFQKKRVLGTVVFSLSCIIFYLIFFKAIPFLHGGNHFALSYYSDFGSSPVAVLKGIFLTPQKTIGTIFSGNRLTFIIQLFSPVAFFSFASPIFLIGSLPDLAIDLLSNNAQLHQIYYQYTAVINSFVLISAIYGFKKVSFKFPNVSVNKLAIVIFISSLISGYFYGPLPGQGAANIDMFNKQLSYAKDIDMFLQDIPTRYSIAATNNVGSHLSHRQKIFTIPTGIETADVVIFLLNDPFAQPSLEKQVEMAENLTKDPNYVQLYREQDFVVYSKKSLNFHKRFRKPSSFLPFLQNLRKSS